MGDLVRPGVIFDASKASILRLFGFVQEGNEGGNVHFCGQLRRVGLFSAFIRVVASG